MPNASTGNSRTVQTAQLHWIRNIPDKSRILLFQGVAGFERIRLKPIYIQCADANKSATTQRMKRRSNYTKNET